MKNAFYNNLKSGMKISDGENFGVIDTVLFDFVLVKWNGDAEPPVYYPRKVWNLCFGCEYEVIEEAQP